MNELLTAIATLSIHTAQLFVQTVHDMEFIQSYDFTLLSLEGFSMHAHNFITGNAVYLV